MEDWLLKIQIFTAEDYALMCSEERQIDEEIVKPAKADGVPMDIKDKVNAKKLWKLCRKEDDSLESSGLADLTEFEKGLPDRTRKTCEQLFLDHHGYALPPGRRLVGTQAAPIHSGSHSMAPNPKDFSLLPVKRMRLEDGSVGTYSNDGEMSIHIIFLKLRAFLYTSVFVNMDQRQFFDLAAAEATADRLLEFLHHRHAAGRPPISHYTNAWEQTARVFQLGVRSGKTLKELVAQESLYQHFWTQYVPDASRTSSRKDDGSSQGKGAGKVGGKNGKKERDRNEGDKTAHIQQAKDREIAALKRQISDMKQEKPGNGGGDFSGKYKKPRWGTWK